MVKALLLFIYHPERKTISRIFELLTVEFGSILQGFMQRDSRTKLEKVFPSDMSLTPHAISSGTTLNLNDVKLLFIAYLMRDSTASL